eukprot:scaffold90964_cov30-Tisochrysis_lutea.AAC.4
MPQMIHADCLLKAVVSPINGRFTLPVSLRAIAAPGLTFNAHAKRTRHRARHGQHFAISTYPHQSCTRAAHGTRSACMRHTAHASIRSTGCHLADWVDSPRVPDQH